MDHCQTCGEEILPGDVACMNCGAPIGGSNANVSSHSQAPRQSQQNQAAQTPSVSMANMPEICDACGMLVSQGQACGSCGARICSTCGTRSRGTTCTGCGARLGSAPNQGQQPLHLHHNTQRTPANLPTTPITQAPLQFQQQHGGQRRPPVVIQPPNANAGRQQRRRQGQQPVWQNQPQTPQQGQVQQTQTTIRWAPMYTWIILLAIIVLLVSRFWGIVPGILTGIGIVVLCLIGWALAVSIPRVIATLQDLWRAFWAHPVRNITIGLLAVLVFVILVSAIPNLGETNPQGNNNPTNPTLGITPTATPTPIAPRSTPAAQVPVNVEYPSKYKGTLLGCGKLSKCPVQLYIENVQGSTFSGVWSADFGDGRGFYNQQKIDNGTIDGLSISWKGAGVIKGTICGDCTYSGSFTDSSGITINGNVTTKDLGGSFTIYKQ